MQYNNINCNMVNDYKFKIKDKTRIGEILNASCSYKKRKSI